MRRIFVFFLQIMALSAYGQSKFTERLQQTEEGKGIVVLHQSQAITDMVNGAKDLANASSSDSSKTYSPTPKVSTSSQVEDSTMVDTPQTGIRTKVNGYRIQVYLGGNSRQSKNEATQMGARVKGIYGNLNVYTHFVSPHWICRVGDFKTYEEANEILRHLKETGRFNEATIVKSKIYTYL